LVRTATGLRVTTNTVSRETTDWGQNSPGGNSGGAPGDGTGPRKLKVVKSAVTKPAGGGILVPGVFEKVRKRH